MTHPQFPLMHKLRLVAVSRRLAVAWSTAGVALVLLLVHIFWPQPLLEWAALWCAGAALAAAWTAIMCWRMPVFSRSTLWAITLLWCLGIALAVALVYASFRPQVPIGWRVAVQWLSLSMGLSVGGLEFRTLFHHRSTSILGRFLSLLSPMLILALILVMWLRG